MNNKILITIAHAIGMSSSQLIDFAGNLVMALLILVIGSKLSKFVLKGAKTIFEKSSIDETLSTFFVSFLRIALKILIIFMAVTQLGVASSTIIALLGSAGLALGLSLQGSLSNIAGGVVLLFIKPFKVGDYILEESSGKEGTVQAIGIMYTKLLTTDHQVVFVPNGNLSNASITNITNEDRRMVEIHVCVDYSEEVEKIKALLEEILHAENQVLDEEENLVYVDSFREYGTQMGLRFWVPTEVYWTTRWAVMEEIKKSFEMHQIKFAARRMDVQMQTSI